jgi:AraC-like DNA-binding protein
MGKAHRHHEIEIGLLTGGYSKMQVGDRTFRMEAGSLSVFWAIVPHRVLAVGNNAAAYVITVPLPFLFQCNVSDAFRRALLSGLVILRDDLGQKRLRLALFKQWLRDFGMKDTQRRQQLLTELQVFIQRLALEFDPLDYFSPSQLLNPARCDRLMRITQFIALHFQEPIQIKDIAREVGLNKEYCATIFRRSCNMTLMNYLLNCRLSHARTLLATGMSTVLNVALESGFGSVSQFHAVFKHETGMSPQTYRRLMSPGA